MNLLTIAMLICSAQGTAGQATTTPEQRRVIGVAQVHRQKAQQLLKDRKFSDAITEYERLFVLGDIAIDRTGDYRGLGLAHQGLGDEAGALRAYRKMMRYHARLGDLDNGSDVAVEYMLLLYKNGKQIEARHLYYAAARRALTVGYLLLPAIFDADPKGDVRAWSENNFRAAVLMLVGNSRHGEGIATARKAQSLAPDWYAPVFYLAHRGAMNSNPTTTYEQRQAWKIAQFGKARNLAPNDLIRGWIDQRRTEVEEERSEGPLTPDPKAIRDEFQCLQESKNWLKTHWHELVDEQTP